MNIRTLIVICCGCRREHTVKVDKPITSAEEFKIWTETQLQFHRCACGAPKCDIKIPMQEVEEKPRG